MGGTRLLGDFIEFKEIPTPSNPAIDVGKLYCKDLADVTTLFLKDSAGVETNLLLGGGTVKQIFSTRLIFTSTSTPRTSSIFGEVLRTNDAGAQTILNSDITAVDNTIFLVTNSKTSTITFALNDDGVDVLQVSTTSGQSGEFSASGSVVVAAGSKINFTEDGGTSVGQLDYSMTLEYTR